MKHSTNYSNVFIEIAEDCPSATGEIPPKKGEKMSVANYQFDLIYNNPYRYTSDQVLFDVFAIRKEIPKGEIEEQQEEFFSKGQPCFRASPLTKRYGWGIHCNESGQMAMYPAESKEYSNYIADSSIEKVKAMRSKKG